MIAPEPQLSACLRVLQVATVEARSLGWSGERESLTVQDAKRLAALMDAVHNLPYLLQHWERMDEARLRADLRRYDDAWGDRSHFRLLDEYERALSGRQQPSS